MRYSCLTGKLIVFSMRDGPWNPPKTHHNTRTKDCLGKAQAQQHEVMQHLRNRVVRQEEIWIEKVLHRAYPGINAGPCEFRDGL